MTATITIADEYYIDSLLAKKSSSKEIANHNLKPLEQKWTEAVENRLCSMGETLTFYQKFFEYRISMAKHSVKCLSDSASLFRQQKDKPIPPLFDLILKFQEMSLSESKRLRVFQTALEEKYLQPLLALQSQQAKNIRRIKDSIYKSYQSKSREWDKVRSMIPKFYRMKSHGTEDGSDPWLSEQHLLVSLKQYAACENQYRKVIADSIYSLVLYERSVFGTLSSLLERFTHEYNELQGELVANQSKMNMVSVEKLATMHDLEAYFQGHGLSMTAEDIIRDEGVRAPIVTPTHLLSAVLNGDPKSLTLNAQNQDSLSNNAVVRQDTESTMQRSASEESSSNNNPIHLQRILKSGMLYRKSKGLFSKGCNKPTFVVLTEGGFLHLYKGTNCGTDSDYLDDPSKLVSPYATIRLSQSYVSETHPTPGVFALSTIITGSGSSFLKDIFSSKNKGSDSCEEVGPNVQENKLFLRAEPRGLMEQWIHEISMFSSSIIPHHKEPKE